MNSKKLECLDDDDSVDGKTSLSFLGKFSYLHSLTNSKRDNIL